MTTTIKTKLFVSITLLITACSSYADYWWTGAIQSEGYFSDPNAACQDSFGCPISSARTCVLEDVGPSGVYKPHQLWCVGYRDGEEFIGGSINRHGLICKSPFVESDNQCVATCPESAPQLDLDTGLCYSDVPVDSCTAGNPIQINTGEKLQYETPDYQEQRVLPLYFARNYRSRRAPLTGPLSNLGYRHYRTGNYYKINSLDDNWVIHYQPSGYTGMKPTSRFGFIPPEEERTHAENLLDVDADKGNLQWRHNYMEFIAIDDDVIVHHPNQGSELRFTNNGNSFVAQTKSPRPLLAFDEVNNKWRLTRVGNLTKVFNTEGQLVRIGKNDQIYQDIFYNEINRIDRVVHSNGGEMQFTYDTDKRIVQVVFPNNSSIQFTYDEFSNPITVVRTENITSETPLVTTRQYHYEDIRHPYALTGITDENNTRYATWKYDEFGRAIESNHGAGMADTVTLNFLDNGDVEIWNALGKKTVYKHRKDQNGVRRLISVEGVASEHCAAANKSYTYDASGYVASKTDWSGNTTTFVRDSVGREVSRTEASGTEDALTIQTEWHPVFDLQTKITEPGRTTEFTYDATGRLTSRSINETTQP